MSRPEIGNRADAMRAVDACWRDGRQQVGVKLVGSGSFRHVYLINGVAYKVPNNFSNEEENTYGSAAELRAVRTLRKRCPNNDGIIGAYVRIPQASGFTIKHMIPPGWWSDEPMEKTSLVVAMEYVDGISPHAAPYNHEARQELFSLGFRDMHSKNFTVEKSTGYLVPLDLGSPRRKMGEWDDGPDIRVFGKNSDRDTIVVRMEDEKRARILAERKRKGIVAACGNSECIWC